MKKIVISLFAVCAMLLASSTISAQVAAKPAEKVKTETKVDQTKTAVKHHKAKAAVKSTDANTATTPKAAVAK
jgi:hypothetical protein